MEEKHRGITDSSIETTLLEIDNEKNKQEETASENKCDICDFKINSKQVLKIHKTKKHTNKPQKCPLYNLQSETYDKSFIHGSIFNYGTMRPNNHFNPRSPAMSQNNFPRGQMFKPRIPHLFPSRFPPCFPRGQMFM